MSGRARYGRGGGRSRELDVRDLELQAGRFAARLHLSVADVVSFRAGEAPRLIEVKATKDGPYKNFSRAERAKLRLAAEISGGTPWLVWWPWGVKEPVWISESEWPT